MITLPNIITSPVIDDFNNYCIRVFSHLNPKSMFLSIKNYRNKFDEYSDFNICFHIDYLNAVKKSYLIIKEFDPDKINIEKEKFSLSTLKFAKKELLYSMECTLAGDNPFYTCKGKYTPILDSNGKEIPGVKLHIRTNYLHINGFKIRKKILKQGNYPKRRSQDLTLAKKFIKNNTPLCNWVQFKLLPDKFDKLSVQKMIIKGKTI